MSRVAVSLPGGRPPDGVFPTDLPAFARLAEELGYESVWRVEGRGDQFSILTACALATKRIGLGTNISSVFVRSAST